MCKSGCNRQNCCIRAKWDYSSNSGCIRESGFTLAKVVVFGQEWFFLGKFVVFGQK